MLPSASPVSSTSSISPLPSTLSGSLKGMFPYLLVGALAILLLSAAGPTGCDTTKQQASLSQAIQQNQEQQRVLVQQAADIQKQVAALPVDAPEQAALTTLLKDTQASNIRLQEQIDVWQATLQALQVAPTTQAEAIRKGGQAIIPFLSPGIQQMVALGLLVFGGVQTRREQVRTAERNAIIRNNELAKNGNGDISLATLAQLNQAAGIDHVVRAIRKPKNSLS